MAMNATKYPNNIRTVSGLNVTVYDNDVELSVNTSTIACSIDLPAIASGYWNTTWKLYVFDASNNASVRNITINAGTGQTINGSSTLVINTNGAGIMVRVLSNTSFIAITTYTAGGGGGGVLSVAAVAPLTSSGGTSPIISSQVTGSTLLGRSTLTAGIMEEITLGTNLAFVGTTLNASGGGITTLNTLTAATQTMVVGTANNDFTITSGTATHTFDLPTASASKRGALSTTDWTTFNNKLSSAYVTVQDEGIALTQRSTMNFVGTAVAATDLGAITTITINAPVIQNTVYVMKSGNDLTGLVERFDKPFLTIAAARAAALVAFTSRTVNNRVKIIVESGNYLEGIIIDNFIDYDLGNSVISPLNTLANTESCIADNGLVAGYTATVKGQYTAMIYGNATFNSANTTPSNGYYGIGITSANSTNLNLYVQCNRINSEYYDSIFMVTGKATVYANYIYCAKTDTNTYSPIRLSCAASNPPTLSVFNALIFNNSNGLAINACVMFENSSGSAVNKCMLTNCQVGSYSSSVSAISCAVNSALGIGQITLNNTIIYTSGAIASITDGFTSIAGTNGANILTAYAYGVYARNTTNFVNTPASQVAVGVVTVNAALIFNQGNSI
jgi:hypothetical protein